MPVSIIANTSAQYAQSSLVKQNELVTKGTLRMSSGSRVLSAADDAAAMAIGTSLKIENSGLKSAILNATAATSMLQIADGALGQVSEILSRMSVLAVQSSSGQYDDPTRELMNGEFMGLKDEIERIANTTSFNGVNILAGMPKYDIAGGSNLAADGIKEVRLDPNMVTGDQSFRYSYDSATERLTLTRVDGGTTTSQSINLTPLLNGSIGAGIDLHSSQKLEVGFSQFGVTLTLGAGFLRGTDIANTVAVNAGTAGIAATTSTFAAAATNVTPTTVADLTALGAVYNPTTGNLNLAMTSAGGAVTLDAIPGISYAVNGGAVGASGAASGDIAGAGPTTVDVYADVATGGQVLLGTVTLTGVTTAADGTGSLDVDAGGGLLTATKAMTPATPTSPAIEEISPRRLTYKVGTGVLSGEDTINVDVPATTLAALGLTNLTIATQADADTAIDAMKAALATLNQGRSNVGAQQTRLDAVGRNLGVISENNEAARSSLMDVDVSAEITDITTNQAMMQASIAMLSRANQQPDILLRLLESN